MSEPELARTPLYALHQSLGATIVPFAGYGMPVQYPAGIRAEHLHTREQAGLFDVSHMGQVRLAGADAVAILERLVPADIAAVAPGRIRYTMFTNPQGGIIDDLMVSNAGDHIRLVINAGGRAKDMAHLGAAFGARAVLLDELALLALQGPKAAAIMARLAPGVEKLGFMSFAAFNIAGIACSIARSGYTGEDGFEISCPAAEAATLARKLLDQPEVAPIGLGARDTLRLEAGLCLYGADITDGTTPIEADLLWTIQKRRRQEGGFTGSGIILDQLAKGPARKRVGIQPEGRAPARAHTEITDRDGRVIGEITSGGFGPSTNTPIAMGYVEAGHAALGTELGLLIRGKSHPARVAPLPFVPHRYHR